MHHIGSRLVALMHEVSSGESMKSNSPKQMRHHRRLQAKISATTTEDDDSTSESNFEDATVNNLPRSKSHDLLLDGKPAQDHMTTEEREASDYERFSWRGSFESALLTNCDSRNKLSALDNSSSALSILAAKRRSAGDLLFTPKSLSREQLDRVRSCGSIGGDHDIENSKLWESTQSQESTRKRTGILEDDTDESSDNDHRLTSTRSTLPRSLQISTITASTTNSLPRLPTTSSSSSSSSSSGAIQKAQSVYQFLQNNVKSARYRAPGFNRPQQAPKRALSAPGLQPGFIARRDRRNKVQSLAMGECLHFFFFFHFPFP
jgi:synaptotagmin-like protein